MANIREQNSAFQELPPGVSLMSDAGWGDNGKGKVATAMPTPDVGLKDIGGHNAGHNIVTDLGEFGLGLVPSTIIHPETRNLIGQEVVLNPMFLKDEIEMLRRGGIDVSPKNLMIDPRSHLVLPWHEVRDALSEEERGADNIGSLHLGVGWTYSDRVNRRGLRVVDLMRDDWRDKVAEEHDKQRVVIDEMVVRVRNKFGDSKTKTDVSETQLYESLEFAREYLRPFVGNTMQEAWLAVDQGKTLLAEDSHGALLDVSDGTWPYATGVSVGLSGLHKSFGGKVARAVSKMVIAMKPYQTRVGGGPLPSDTSEIKNFGNYVREKGQERGTRSKRERRCGAFDGPANRYGLDVLGAGEDDEVALTKLDILSGLDEIPVCIAYEVDGIRYSTAPQMDAQFLSKVKPIFVWLKGWKEDISHMRDFRDLPEQAKAYVRFLQEVTGKKISLIGTGKHKDDYILPGGLIYSS